MTPLQETIVEAFNFVLKALPIIVPIVLLKLVHDNYTDYTKTKYLNSIEWVLLEIVPPEDIEKSPAAMELFFHALYDTSGESTWIDKKLDGKVRNWFSLEIVSVEGVVKFFIRTNVKMRSIVESQLYAQYPGVEIHEAEDYAAGVEYNPSEIEVYGAEWALAAPDPYPIKTYVDYGLDKETEEGYKNDPITPMLEFMGSLGEGEQAWVQYIIRAHKKEDKDPTPFFGPKGKWAKPKDWSKKVDMWEETAKKEIEGIREKATLERGEGENKQYVNVMTKGKELQISALERSVSKVAFDAGVRTIYLAQKDVFNKSNIGGLLGTLRAFGSADLNGFKPTVLSKFDYPWQDFSGKKVFKIKTAILDAYKDRQYFHRYILGKPRKKAVLNVEELATVFHLPGRVAFTPNLNRVTSKKSTPPANLPT